MEVSRLAGLLVFCSLTLFFFFCFLRSTGPISLELCPDESHSGWEDEHGRDILDQRSALPSQHRLRHRGWFSRFLRLHACVSRNPLWTRLVLLLPILSSDSKLQPLQLHEVSSGALWW